MGKMKANMNDKIEETVKDLMVRVLRVDAALINHRASPETIGSWDSLHHMKLILALEEEFEITFNEDQLVQMNTLPRIVAAVAAAKS